VPRKPVSAPMAELCKNASLTRSEPKMILLMSNLANDPPRLHIVNKA
jgi:hypothetical protein